MAYDLATLLSELVKGQQFTEDEKKAWYAAIARDFGPEPEPVAPAAAAPDPQVADLQAQIDALNAQLAAKDEAEPPAVAGP